MSGIAEDTTFSRLTDDVVLTILFKLEDDPRHWARLACVSSKFSSLVRHVCCKAKCSATIPAVASDLLPPLPSSSSSAASASPPTGGWSALHKLAVCCPGLLHAGVLLENSDFGLERELGPNHDLSLVRSIPDPDSSPPTGSSDTITTTTTTTNDNNNSSSNNCSWSLFDDLYLDTVYDVSEDQNPQKHTQMQIKEGEGEGEAVESESESKSERVPDSMERGRQFYMRKKRRVCRSLRPHLASEVWNLCREQGNKLLASRFRDDCLYICDWPGCIHTEEKRNYMLFRGIFKSFKRSRVWRTISDGNRSKIALSCAFCSCDETWDLHSAFCLRQVFGYHDDGEPVVRAYVCENGHVSGAWTDWPLYT